MNTKQKLIDLFKKISDEDDRFRIFTEDTE